MFTSIKQLAGIVKHQVKKEIELTRKGESKVAKKAKKASCVTSIAVSGVGFAGIPILAFSGASAATIWAFTGIVVAATLPAAAIIVTIDQLESKGKKREIDSFVKEVIKDDKSVAEGCKVLLEGIKQK